ncbi:ABC transporter permease [Cyclobacteriaceae bacterium]|jgi:putative ABC transport system permease protein|nr:ABC transporter permease [Cyclobacteriaceae bacterium]|tara:strand:+ start:543 stop:1889 length:1347 start_codon:yes stop_codon:yes gene_type:complete
MKPSMENNFPDKERLIANLNIAFEAVLSNRVRSILTGLGIIFGVAAVIAMLAIGNGAQKEIIDQIKLVGLNNIVIKPIVEQKEEAVSAEDPFNKEKNKYSPGLTLKDKNSIADMLPDIQAISPEIVQDTYIMNNGVRRSAKLVGVEPPYFKLFNFELEEGHMFNEQNLIHGMPVCIIGKSIKAKFFPSENPIGKKLKCGNQWLTVMGVLEQRIISENSIKRLGIRDYNMDVYVPLKTVLIRYENRDLITKSMINNADDEKISTTNYHQLDRLVLQVAETEKLSATADIIARMLARKHFDVVDYEIEIPELLLKQQQRTNDIFNYVLGAIAGISLLVGGIGIMNIMLASVLERIKEIGLRLSIGAKKTDIVFQFMFEAIMISATGGIIGIFTGILMAYGVSTIAGIPTLISFGSIFISFGVATLIGLIFGIAPARKAAQQNPITSLRYE